MTQSWPDGGDHETMVADAGDHGDQAHSAGVSASVTSGRSHSGTAIDGRLTFLLYHDAVKPKHIVRRQRRVKFVSNFVNCNIVLFFSYL